MTFGSYPFPLRERIARAVWEACAHDPLTPTISATSAGEVADAVLPIVHSDIAAACAVAWDKAVSSLRYPDGSPVEVLSNSNPYRPEED